MLPGHGWEQVRPCWLKRALEVQLQIDELNSPEVTEAQRDHMVGVTAQTRSAGDN